MAKLKITADFLMEMLMKRPNFVTLNNVTFDPVYRNVTFEVVGSDVPESERVTIQYETVSSKLIPLE